MPKPKEINWDFLDIDEKTVEMANKVVKLVGVIHEGTKSIKFSVYTTPDLKLVESHSIDLTVISPNDGWFEQDPIEIIESINKCAAKVCTKLSSSGYKTSDIISIGITNQRETTVVWDKYTGEPLYNAIAWNDMRADSTVDMIVGRLPDKNKNHFKHITGLTVHPYFSAIKLRWLKDNVPVVRKACREKRCLAGTVDSWVIWNLTGGPNGGLHITDVSNASRTLLMNIETLNWDPLLIKTFNVHRDMLPEIRSSSEIYGQVNNDSVLNGINISAIIGNQQAALLGEMCIKPGQTKCTYRSGCFLLCNTGETKVFSERGLLTTVAYKLGKNAPTIFALEGAVAVGGYALNWLKNGLGILSDVNEAEDVASAVNSTGNVYFVPAFTGLYAPYWRKDARGVICGLTQYTTRNHIIRAALEAICFQNRDILECILEEYQESKLDKLYTDGELSSNSLLMQLQADIFGSPVFRSQVQDTSSFGTAICAAQADGINAFVLNQEKINTEITAYDTFLPTTDEEERCLRYHKWKKAIQRSLGWVKPKQTVIMTEERYKLLASLSGALFFITSFALLVYAKSR